MTHLKHESDGESMLIEFDDPDQNRRAVFGIGLLGEMIVIIRPLNGQSEELPGRSINVPAEVTTMIRDHLDTVLPRSSCPVCTADFGYVRIGGVVQCANCGATKR